MRASSGWVCVAAGRRAPRAPRCRRGKGASPRTPKRSLADLARGFAASSASPAVIGPPIVDEAALGLALAVGRCRDSACRGAVRSRRKRLTMRSSSEWKVTTTSRPPGPRSEAAPTSPRTSSPSSSLTAMRSAWKLRVAGSMPSRDGRHRSRDDAPQFARRADRRLLAAPRRWRARRVRHAALRRRGAACRRAVDPG